MPQIPSKPWDQIEEMIETCDVSFRHTSHEDLKKAILVPTELHGVLTFSGTIRVVKNSDYDHITDHQVVYNGKQNIVCLAKPTEHLSTRAAVRISKTQTEDVNTFIKKVCSLQQQYQQNLLE